jgi:hypothetical protein
LANIILDDLDKELEKRGHKFCRYADDCNIYIRSRKADERVMLSISDFIEKKLKLKINKDKSAVDKPMRRKFLGFSFYYKSDKIIGIRAHQKSIARLKAGLKKATGRSNGKSIKEKIKLVNYKTIGWINYFLISDIKGICRNIDRWLRRRIRMCIWKQWKRIKTRHKNLVKMGVDYYRAWEWANTRKGYWHISNSPILSTTLTNKVLDNIGFVSLTNRLRLGKSF